MQNKCTSLRGILLQAEIVIKEHRFFIFESEDGKKNFYTDTHKMMELIFSNPNNNSLYAYLSEEFYKKEINEYYQKHPHFGWLGGCIPARVCYLITILGYHNHIKLLKINENKYALVHVDAKLDDFVEAHLIELL